jgi:glycosyltransferase involved in cell wall biosynthesis
MHKVAIVQKALVQYRKDFHNQLREKLKQNDVELTLIYSKYQGKDSAKKDEIDLDWATLVPSKFIKLGPVELLWQSSLPHIKNKDLVIVEQANKNLLNYLLFIKRYVGGQKFAYWGHGVNRQINQDDIRNKFKKAFQNKSDWWFAYTKRVKEYLVESGYPAKQVTSVDNAIDTKFLSDTYDTITQQEVQKLRTQLAIESENIGIYCGGIYKEKNIPFLIEACELIRKAVPDFHVLVIGSGPDTYLVEEAAKRTSWIHYLGPKFGKDKIQYFKISRVFLMPGLVGLAILDSFAMQTPTVTTNYLFHSPEIEYLENGENGLITNENTTEYASAVVRVLKDNTLRAQLIEGCKKSASKYTIENMVNNFTEGILKCLGKRPK